MTSRRENQLLRALYDLYLQYGQQDFEAALTKLTDRKAIESFLKTIETGYRVFEQNTTLKRQESKTSLPDTRREQLDLLLNQWRGTGTNEMLMLSNFIEEISKGNLLKGSNLRRFANILAI
jgi:hypothetical protein